MVISESFAAVDNLVPQIVEKGDDYWELTIHLSIDELLDNRKLLSRLWNLKKHISTKEKIPIGILHYEGIKKRRQVDNLMEITVRLIRKPVEKGDPVVRLLEKTGEDGTVYTDMQAVLTIYPLDSLEQKITPEKVLLAIKQSGITENLLDVESVHQKVQQITDTLESMSDVPIAEGSLPDLGEDAQIEFFFPAQPSEENSQEYYCSRQVKQGDLICRKTPSKMGANPGINVKGKEIPPRKGIDIKLNALEGAAIAVDQCQVHAEENGVVTIRTLETKKKVLNGQKVIPAEIQLKVSPILKIDGDEKVDITTAHTVEVEGNLKIGSRIITNGEVHVAGSVEEGSVVRSLDNITVEGNVSKAELSSDQNVIASGEVSDSKIVAKGKIIVDSKIQQSRIVGKEICAKAVSGSTIYASNQITMVSLDDDESGMISTIAVGSREFFEDIYEENISFLEQATGNMDRICKVFGRPFINNVTHSNLHMQWIQFCAKARKENKKYTHNQLVSLKKLFENIPTLRVMIQEKTKENQRIEQRITETSSEESVIVVREKVGKTQEVKVNGMPVTLKATDQGVRINSDVPQNSGQTPAIA